MMQRDTLNNRKLSWGAMALLAYIEDGYISQTIFRMGTDEILSLKDGVSRDDVDGYMTELKSQGYLS